MDLGLSGSVAAVFGAARGIGAAIADAFAAEGAAVAAIDRDPCPTDPVQNPNPTPNQNQGRRMARTADVTDAAAVRDVVDEIHRSLGRLDHVVFAVGMGSGKFGFPFWNLDPGDWDRVLRVNLIGAVNVAHAVAPGMAAAGSGTLLFLSSIAGQIGSQTDPPYSAAKAGLINFAQCAARDLAPHNVRVNTICPGMVKTELNRSVWEAWTRRTPSSHEGPRAASGSAPPLAEDESRRTASADTPQSYEDWAGEKIRRLVPLNRWQTPEDVAAMAVFLASPRAHNITGQTVNVDGGFVMHW
jgi:NAD(P)-dependent dehydrogenase (short-subunit alcohol dehydrogenase family)